MWRLITRAVCARCTDARGTATPGALSSTLTEPSICLQHTNWRGGLMRRFCSCWQPQQSTQCPSGCEGLTGNYNHVLQTPHRRHAFFVSALAFAAAITSLRPLACNTRTCIRLFSPSGHSRHVTPARTQKLARYVCWDSQQPARGIPCKACAAVLRACGYAAAAAASAQTLYSTGVAAESPLQGQTARGRSPQCCCRTP